MSISNPGTVDETNGGPSVKVGDSASKRVEQSNRDIVARLSRIEGQRRGIRNMHSEERDCIDVVTQIAAVRAALKKVADVLVATHVEAWLAQAAANPNDTEAQDIQELLKVFTQYYR